MIDITLTALPADRGRKGTRFRAAATVAGEEFAADSTAGATCALARMLVAAGIPDQPARVLFRGRHALQIASIHRHAEITYAEGDTGELQRKPFRPFDDAISVGAVKPPEPHLGGEATEGA